MPKKVKPTHGEYAGVLTEPIMVPPITLFANEKDKTAYVAQEINKKIEALYAHFEIDSDSSDAENQLITLLATNHVKGFALQFTPTKKVGRPPAWRSAAGVQLYVDVQTLVDAGKTVSEACRDLCKDDKYSDDKPVSLQKRFYEVKRKWGEEHCAAIDSLIKTLPEYFPDTIWTATAPDGSALFQSFEIARSFTSMLSHPSIQK